MSENGEIYTAGKNFTLPPAVTAWTNSTSEVKGIFQGNSKQKIMSLYGLAFGIGCPFFAHSFYSSLNTDACGMMTKLLGRMGVEPLQVGGGSCAAGGGDAVGGQVEAAHVGPQLEGDGGGGRGEPY